MLAHMTIFSPFKRNLFKEQFWNPHVHRLSPSPRPTQRSGGTARVGAGSRAGVQGPPHSTFPFPGSQLACGFYVQGYLFSNQRH